MIEVRRFAGEDDVIYVRRGDSLYEVTLDGLSVVMPEDDECVFYEDLMAYRQALLDDTEEVSIDTCDPRLVQLIHFFLTPEDYGGLS